MDTRVRCKGTFQCFKYQWIIVVLTYGIAYYPAVVQIQYGAKV